MGFSCAGLCRERSQDEADSGGREEEPSTGFDIRLNWLWGAGDGVGPGVTFRCLT